MSKEIIMKPERKKRELIKKAKKSLKLRKRIVKIKDTEVDGKSLKAVLLEALDSDFPFFTYDMLLTDIIYEDNRDELINIIKKTVSHINHYGLIQDDKL